MRYNLLFGAGLTSLPGAAFATDQIFTGRSPIMAFTDFILGPFAYMLIILGLVATLGGLILGSDMGGFARRAPLAVLAGAVLAGANIMASTLFGESRAYTIPEVWRTEYTQDLPVSAPEPPDPSTVREVLK